MTSSSKPEEYGSREFWEAKFQAILDEEREHEEIIGTKEAVDAMTLFMHSKGDKILLLGCGVSRMPGELFNRGWSNICAVDFARNAIEHLKLRDVHLHGVRYSCLDCGKDLKGLPDDGFDVVVEKGFLDAIFASGGIRRIPGLLNDIKRKMKNDGRFISFSRTTPPCRLPYLKEIFAKVDSFKPSMKPHAFAFICRPTKILSDH